MDKTYANINKATKFLKFKNKVKIEKGILKFVNWYIRYNKIKK